MDGRTPALMDRLADETRDLRRCIDGERDLLDGRRSWLDYRRYLVRLYGFHAPAEAALAASQGLGSVVADAAQRIVKVPLLAHDLMMLGLDRQELAQLPRIPAPALAELSDALGWLYVVERLTLDSVRQARLVATRLPSEIDFAGAYVRGHGRDLGARWRDLGTALDGWAARGGDADGVVQAALEATTRLHRWLRPTAGNRGASIHA